MSGWRGIPTVMALAIFAGLLMIGALWVSGMTDQLAMRTLPECKTEYQDSPDCAWHAKRHGSGIGTSFYIRNGIVHFV